MVVPFLRQHSSELAGPVKDATNLVHLNLAENPLPRRWVNKGKKKGVEQYGPRPVGDEFVMNFVPRHFPITPCKRISEK